MQVQRIAPYPKYSSNRVQRTEAKNSNFGMKITYDEWELAKIVGQDNVAAGKHIIETCEQHLAERFKKVMAGLKYSGRAKQIFNPKAHIKDWDKIELMLRFKSENGKVKVQLIDTQNIAGAGEEYKEENVLRNLIVALNNGLDVYAKRKILDCVLA